MKTISVSFLLQIVMLLGTVQAAELPVPLAGAKTISVYSDKDEKKESHTEIKVAVTDSLLHPDQRLTDLDNAGYHAPV